MIFVSTEAQAKKLSAIRGEVPTLKTVIAFDEDPITLGGVREGTIAGTVVQQPYEWGYQGMKLMAKYLEGDKSVVPDNKLVIVPTAIIDKSNVDAFEAELKSRIGGG